MVHALTNFAHNASVFMPHSAREPVLEQLHPPRVIECGNIRVAYACCFHVHDNLAWGGSGFWHLIKFKRFISSYKLPGFHDRHLSPSTLRIQS